MRSKLQKFTKFTEELLPHEVEYLRSIEQFQDEDRLAILNRIAYNLEEEESIDFDTSIDKRKYSNLKNWVTERLENIDVDIQFELMTHLEKQIMTDSITAEEERKLLKLIRNYNDPVFYFTKFYELAQHYRHFLLIRMRYADHKLVDDFLKNHKKSYERSRRINERLHEATVDIVNQYASYDTEAIKWERWLTKAFYDETLDGLNRYLALIRLIFLAFNYRNFEHLRQPFDYLDDLFRQGKYYSKRLLLNYYGNRLLLHTKFKELDKAVHYGYLSIRGKNNEYIHYINNLSAVLQRQKKYKEALDLMREAFPEMKATQNYHDKIGFVAFYVKALISTEAYRNAENYSESFLRAYREEIFKYRWHIFFTAYLEALLKQEKYTKVLKVAQKYRLLEKDMTYQKRAVYLPTIAWYVKVAQYKDYQIDRKTFSEEIFSFIDSVKEDTDKLRQTAEIVQAITPYVPEVIQRIRPKLYDFKGVF